MARVVRLKGRESSSVRLIRRPTSYELTTKALWLSVMLLSGFRLGLLASVAVAEDKPPATLAAALKSGEVKIKLRYRFENVEDDRFDKDGRSSTLRSTLGYHSQPFRGFSLVLEAENSTEVGSRGLFNDLGGNPANNAADRPVVADPRSTEINQAYLRFARGSTRVDVGRQEIAVADQRFIGPVGWRQNHQSFDHFGLTHAFNDRVSFTYRYLDEVHRILGDHKPMSSHLLDGAFKLPQFKLRVYVYSLDFDRLADAALSTATHGFELTGQRKFGEVECFFEVEIAEQRETGDHPGEIDASYQHTVLGGRLAGWTLQAGFESLEGGAGGRFTTPLATLHKWNGWADKFLATPPAGLEDFYLAISGDIRKIAWKAIYHDFSAESRSLDYGSELDLRLTFGASWGQSFGAKAAFYQADDFSADTDKLWLWTSYTF